MSKDKALPSKNKSLKGIMKTKLEQFPLKNPNPVLTVAVDGTLLYSNEAGEPLLQEWGLRVGEKLSSSIGKIVQRVISQNSPERMEVKVGNRVYLVAFHPSPEGECVNIYGFDISDQKELEGKLRESEMLYRTLIKHSMDAIILADPRNGGKILSANPAACGMLRWSEEELIGKRCNEMFDLQDPAQSNLLAECARSGSVRAQLTYMRKDGTTFTGEISTASFTDSNGEPRTVDIIRDVTERKKSEEALQKVHDSLEVKVRERTAELEAAYKSLKESERHLAEAQRMAHIGNWEWNILTDKIYWSEEMFRIFGRSPQEGAPNYNEFLNFIHPEDRDFAFSTIKNTISGKPRSIIYRIVLANEEERTIYKQSEVILDGENNPIRIRGIAQDITERKKSEEALANIETARKQEIHHRIKNNLQVISSLLDLQAEQFKNREYIKNSEILEAFRESQDRVISMALIHEELHKGNRFETLNFSPYIEELAESLFHTYTIGSSDISLKLDLEQNISFDMDTAVPLGIIVNELVSNALKYAFSDGEAGEITIRLQREENEEQIYSLDKDRSITFILSVSDNGVGIAENLDIEDLDSLGLQLVTTLVDQLGGELEIKRNKGTKFAIRFTVTEKNNQTSAQVLQLVDNE